MVSLLHPAVMPGNFCDHLATSQHIEWGSSQKTGERKTGVLKYPVWSPFLSSLGFLICEMINSLRDIVL